MLCYLPYRSCDNHLYCCPTISVGSITLGSFHRETEWGPVGPWGTNVFLAPAVMTFHEFQRVDFLTVPPFLEVKWGTVKKPTEARLKGPEKLIKISRLITWDEIKEVKTLLTTCSCQRPHFWTAIIKTHIKYSGFDTHNFLRQKHGGSLFAWQNKKDTLYCCSVAKLCWTLYNPMDFKPPGSSVLYYLPEFVQIHVHWVTDAI